jgi:hypothetical protein
MRPNHGRIFNGHTNMRYSDIIDYHRHWDSAKFPFVAHVEIASSHLRDLATLINDQTQMKMRGHDLANDGLVVVHIACASEEVQHQVKDRWV